jgi:hypothetical protein
MNAPRRCSAEPEILWRGRVAKPPRLLPKARNAGAFRHGEAARRDFEDTPRLGAIPT